MMNRSILCLTLTCVSLVMVGCGDDEPAETPSAEADVTEADSGDVGGVNMIPASKMIQHPHHGLHHGHDHAQDVHRRAPV